MGRQSITSAGPRRSAEMTAADDALAKMGYKAELPRSLSMLSVLGLSFAIGTYEKKRRKNDKLVLA